MVQLFAVSYVASAVFVTVGVYYRSKIEIKLSEESFNCSVLTRIVGHLWKKKIGKNVHRFCNSHSPDKLYQSQVVTRRKKLFLSHTTFFSFICVTVVVKPKPIPSSFHDKSESITKLNLSYSFVGFWLWVHYADVYSYPSILKLNATWLLVHKTIGRSYIDLVDEVEDSSNSQPFSGVDSTVSVDSLLVVADVVADLQCKWMYHSNYHFGIYGGTLVFRKQRNCMLRLLVESLMEQNFRNVKCSN